MSPSSHTIATSDKSPDTQPSGPGGGGPPPSDPDPENALHEPLPAWKGSLQMPGATAGEVALYLLAGEPQERHLTSPVVSMVDRYVVETAALLSLILERIDDRDVRDLLQAHAERGRGVRLFVRRAA